MQNKSLPPPAAQYITREGYTRLEKELRDLWQVQRPKVTQAVTEAAAQGDRSENAEYIYGKKQLRAIDRRIRFLSQRLDKLQIIEQPPRETTRIYFAAWVTLEDQHGQTHQYRLVGSDEFDLSKGYLSINSPLAKAMLGKYCEDEICVQTPTGEQFYTIIAIRYDGWLF